MKKRKKKNYKENLLNLQDKIQSFGHLFDNPVNHNYKDINTSSWFDIKIAKNDNLFANDFNITYDDIEHDGFFTRKIDLYPTDFQKNIILKWMSAYIIMYNVIIKYFNQCKHSKTKPIVNLAKLKKKFYNDKNAIREKVKVIVNNKEKKLDSHTLDYAINDALNRYKSCMTNMYNGNIKTFRLRYLKQNKNNRLIKFEKSCVKDSTIFKNVLGDTLKCGIDGFNYLKNYHTVMTLYYSKKTDSFSLLVKYKVKDESETEKNKNKNEIISLDPGIRTVLTGYSNNHIIKIGTNVQKSIKKRLQIIDKIRNYNNIRVTKKKGIIEVKRKYISENKKNKIINKRYMKIKNRIKDLQWKTVKYLTENYKTILIGNFSTKEMGEKETMSKMIKRIGNALNIYQLKEKLKYRSKYTNTNYKEVEESYTSKCCSNCKNYNKELKGEKIYKCKKCRIEIDRDINGAKNIMIKSII